MQVLPSSWCQPNFCESRRWMLICSTQIRRFFTFGFRAQDTPPANPETKQVHHRNWATCDIWQFLQQLTRSHHTRPATSCDSLGSDHPRPSPRSFSIHLLFHTKVQFNHEQTTKQHLLTHDMFSFKTKKRNKKKYDAKMPYCQNCHLHPPIFF